MFGAVEGVWFCGDELSFFLARNLFASVISFIPLLTLDGPAHIGSSRGGWHALDALLNALFPCLIVYVRLSHAADRKLELNSRVRLPYLDVGIQNNGSTVSLDLAVQVCGCRSSWCVRNGGRNARGQESMRS